MSITRVAIVLSQPTDSEFRRPHREYGYLRSSRAFMFFRCQPRFRQINHWGMSDMDPGLLARIIDRVVANGRVIRRAPEGGCSGRDHHVGRLLFRLPAFPSRA